MKIILFSALFLFFPTILSAQVFEKLDCDIIQKAQFKKTKIKVCDKTLEVELADSDWLRTIGLMCRKSLASDSGMLFVFEKERRLSFWMKKTYIPLSIAYFTKDKFLKDIFHMEPLNEHKTYASSEESLYALEVNQGWFEKNKIKRGCKLDILATKAQ